MVAGAGVIFFALVLFGAPLDPMLATWGLTPLMAAVLVGAAQNVFSKSSKYSLFDPCKEMAYIPLDQETQVRPPPPPHPDLHEGTAEPRRPIAGRLAYTPHDGRCFFVWCKQLFNASAARRSVCMEVNW